MCNEGYSSHFSVILSVCAMTFQNLCSFHAGNRDQMGARYVLLALKFARFFKTGPVSEKIVKLSPLNFYKVWAP